ncbi:MAG: hypothetical protein OSJ35_09205, partial [Alistipes sp.]|nr:hypothetical protein [Alistipes sp.]
QAAVNTRTQRTVKPFARLSLLSGFTFEELKFKLPAFVEPALFGELLQDQPPEPTLDNAPEARLR